MIEHSDDLGAILTAEMGKPLAEAKSEISHAAAYVQWYAEEASRIYGETIPGPSIDRRMLVIKQPIGVVGAITPWSFPASMVTRKISPALAAGCTVVLKPAEQTPLIAAAMFNLAKLAGIPDGVLNLVYASEGDAIGRELCVNPKVRKISFTGSTEVGRLLMRQCSDLIKRISFELGGNAPFIVFDDAEIDAAVEGAIQLRERSKRSFAMLDRLAYPPIGFTFSRGSMLNLSRSSLSACGCLRSDGFDPDVTIGPLINGNALEKIELHIADVVQKGGKGSLRRTSAWNFRNILRTDCGYGRCEIDAWGARRDVWSACTSFPLRGLRRRDPRSQRHHYGLAAYFYASNLKRVWRVAEALEYGMVGINTGRMSSKAAPFGGIKQSGIGREGVVSM